MSWITQKAAWFELGVCGLLVGTLLLHVGFPGLDETIKSESSNPELEYFKLGQYYFNHDDNPAPPYDLEKAAHYYRLAVEIDPNVNQMAWHQLGRVHFITGEFSQAVFYFQKQLEYFGDAVPNVYYMLGLTYGFNAKQSNNTFYWEQAANNFQKFLEYEPDSPWAQTDLAWVYFAQGKYEEMVPVLEEGLEQNPSHPWLLNMYGLALLNTEQKEAALQNFVRAQEEAVKLTPADWGAAYPGNNPEDWAQGLKEFQTAIENNIALAQS